MRKWSLGVGAIALSSCLLACGGAPSPSTAEVAVPTPQSAAAPVDSSPPALRRAPTPPAPTPGPKVASLPGTSIRYEGGDGSSSDHPIKILGATGESDGVRAEYQYLELVYGAGKWKTSQQSLLEVNGKKIDQLDVDHPGGPSNSVYFDISDYFGKF